MTVKTEAEVRPWINAIWLLPLLYTSTSPTPTLSGMEPENVAVVPEISIVPELVFRSVAVVPTER